MRSFDRLKEKLAELFQFDQADLDFGIYRIMNLRRDEINHFLQHELLPQVREALAEYESAGRGALQQQLQEAEEQARSLGMDPKDAPKVQELRQRYEAAGGDMGAVENEVYDHLYRFFSRYYDEGDFISLRRYKDGVYAIPYEGEEVKLYWANHDQYYVKTTEYFRDYAFRTSDGARVHFKLVEADTEKDNNKASKGKDRRFLLHGDLPVAEENGELVIRFEYRPDDQKRGMDQVNHETVHRVLAELEDRKLVPWRERLVALYRPASGSAAERTLLEKHLYDYARRNTFDYFIHKDLAGFLRRELDFYIKNEVVRLDDLESESAPRTDQYLSKVRAIRSIAHKIIDFLAQIEEFEKKLWLKKKFVVETEYCLTIDHVLSIPNGQVVEELLQEIAGNSAQREDWVRLFAIDEIAADLVTPGYSEPLTTAFLRANPFLVLDTRFFGGDLKTKLLAHCRDLDHQVDGLIVQSNNLQAFNLMHARYSGAIDCIYADPPFNTNDETFVYKNGYRHSSWCAMMRDSTELGKLLLASSGVMAIAIDDLELHHLGLVCDEVFGLVGRLGVLTVEIKPSGRTNDNFLATSQEYYLFYGCDPANTQIAFFGLTEQQRQQYAEEDEKGAYKWRDFLRTGGYSTPEERPNSYYPIYYCENTGAISLEKSQGCIEIWPIDSEGRARVWRKTPPSFLRHLAQGEIRVACSRSGAPKIQIIDRIKRGTRPKSVWTGSRYDAASHGTKLLKAILGDAGAFSFPKSVHATHDVLYVVTGDEPDALILDGFAGSGTTGHAVIQLNQEDEGNRKYILVEMADYFDTVLLPRMKKVIYARSWKDGKPVSRQDGSSQMFKYLRLESYEDALANIQLARTPEQQSLLQGPSSFREEYMLKYALDSEAKDSASLLNVDHFDDPFSYQIFVGTGSVGELKPVKVDLVETFNWLLGLRVKHIDCIRGFRIVEGTNPAGDKALVIWRKIRDLALTDPEQIAAAREQANCDLDEFFRKQQYNTLDSEYDLIYVNGDNNLMNIPLAPERQGVEPRYKVRLIEEEFRRLMFDVQDL